MGIEFLRETEKTSDEKSNTAHCCVCNKPYSDGEIGWVYRSLYKVYTCSNECYTSDEYKMLLVEEDIWSDERLDALHQVNMADTKVQR